MLRNKILSLCTLLLIPVAIQANNLQRRQYVGVFYPRDITVQGIKFGNWGSRPYEYAWASRVVPLAGKKIIDLGTGIPSQYNWYKHVITKLNPAFYVGIDYDNRILNELESGNNYEIKHMSMAEINYPDSCFDVALCISTYEHIPYEIFMKAFEETYRVLKNDGLLVITLDEEWDKDAAFCHSNSWNELEQSLINKGLFKRNKRSFGLPEFLELIKNYFVLAQEDAVVDTQKGIIYSNKDGHIYYNRKDKDRTLLNSGHPVNSCVSYAVLKKAK